MKSQNFFLMLFLVFGHFAQSTRTVHANTILPELPAGPARFSVSCPKSAPVTVHLIPRKIPGMSIAENYPDFDGYAASTSSHVSDDKRQFICRYKYGYADTAVQYTTPIPKDLVCESSPGGFDCRRSVAAQPVPPVAPAIPMPIYQK